MRRRANRARHRRSRDPRGHWLLLLLILPVMFGALLFEGWTTHEVDAAKTRKACTSPVPRSVDKGGPVLRFHDGKAVSSAVPARTVALTYDGGPDPVWTPRLLDLLRKYHAHATFFLRGAQAAQYPDLVRRIRDEGHEIGSNTYTGAAMGASSPLRASLEQSLTQKVLAGSAGLHTKLLRLPQTTGVDTMCGAEWKAARKAGAEGYTLVAADRWFRNPSQGVIRQFGQNDLAYLGTKELLDNPKADRFTTVTAGVGQPSPDEPASGVERWSGTALIWAKALGHAFISAMAWVLAVAGGLGLLRLAMLVFFARTHVRRLTRIRPGSTVLREVTDPVTVLVPAYNEAAGIESTLRSLLASTHRQLQIIVIDDGSSDGTADIAARIGDPRVRVIRQANAGKAAALNTGLAHARYEIVVMVDADTVFEPDAIHHLIQPLAHPAVGAVSGNTKVGNRRRLLGRWQHLEYVFGFNLDRRMFEVLECMPTVPGAIGAFRRDALMGVGGVSEDTLAEDTDLTMALWQAGWRVLYEESAIAWTEVPTSLRQLWRQRYRWCYGTIQAMWKHRGVVVQRGPAGRSGRRGLSYLVLFQVALPLFAPVVDVFALYGLLFLGPWQSAGVWCGFLLVQLLCAGYALRLDGEKLRSLWAMPFQLLVYRQLMYLVVIQSVVAFLLGTRLKWHRMHRSGTAAQQLGQPVAYRRLKSR
ncbi:MULTISPECIES: bifunctional polysaccharide deacetylase/glycosyltransferase family 2 protein [unclassified Streptomyces]|uniref:bifunctional polysaccharide deacetylase/glycosyltransferase family 2 protein n=1 Tax=unclassified Streptomyces TaxID=2593676 RepID=UPI00088A6999|nr:MULTISPECIES: glycosyltransferase [unclassified Streptomyces]PBC81623.1 cellulose synthase/poly-beta-1,6-N-acetylglucosamine synthase-like glycosyltransferase [Streptomyces sp. 2321.6]SDR53940.1 Glycosyltransferase, catalytic subunit of cellulose synthase and poly-beta-1,6-N-acetylglucosamine synthase [Streptomyces sp. KS_16]SEC23291.1 Glycosyltransferase, catalytic subunit of cellulose synthase and poly-beta-1,6-N-acetylglucosamine synthase [Streptomyces sp. 2133.1]SEF06408.1 Glycosyltransf